MIRKNDALDYHRRAAAERSRSFRPSRCVTPARPVARLLARASPSRASRSRATPRLAWEYTARGNLVAVITNGTAVLGLGNIGPLAGKPVMEGKACLFKKFADIDVFDLEVDAQRRRRASSTSSRRSSRRSAASTSRTSRRPSASRSRRAARAHADPGVPRRPARHRDHLGRGAAQRRRARGQEARRHEGRRLGRRRVARSRAPKFYVVARRARARTSRMVDSMGVIYAGRTEGMNRYKARVRAHATTARARSPTRCAAPTCSWACRRPGSCTPEMLKTMARAPDHLRARQPRSGDQLPRRARRRGPTRSSRPAASDFPNQVNNVLGFPYIFRGALDVRAQARSTRR